LLRNPLLAKFILFGVVPEGTPRYGEESIFGHWQAGRAWKESVLCSSHCSVHIVRIVQGTELPATVTGFDQRAVMSICVPYRPYTARHVLASPLVGILSQSLLLYGSVVSRVEPTIQELGHQVFFGFGDSVSISQTFKFN
jgi:hypothetical protein